MRNRNTYIILESKRKVSILFALTMILEIVLLANSKYVLCVILIPLTIGIFLSSPGFEIDRNLKKYRSITVFMGLKLGFWRQLPDIKYINLLRVRIGIKIYQSLSFVTVYTPNEFRYQINLIINGNRQLRLISTTKEEAIEEGLKLGKYLDLKVLDFTTPRKKWIR